MEDIRKRIVPFHFPLKTILGDEAFKGDIIFNIGGFASSGVPFMMRDASTDLLRKEEVQYDEFCVITKPFPWLRLLMPDINQLPFEDILDVKYCDLVIKENPEVKLVVFKGPIFSSIAEQKVDRAIQRYKKDNNIAPDTYFLFCNYSQDWPWCKILLTNVYEFAKEMDLKVS